MVYEDDEQIEPTAAENLRRQLRQRDFKTALASAHKPPANDPNLKAILNRLDEAEKKQR